MELKGDYGLTSGFNVSFRRERLGFFNITHRDVRGFTSE